MPELTIRAADSSLAMDEIERKLGPDALILSTKKRDGLIEIIATNEPDQVASASIASAEKLKLRMKSGGIKTVDGIITAAADKSKLRIQHQEPENEKIIDGKVNFSDTLAAEFSTINEAHSNELEGQDDTQDPTGLMPSIQKIVNELEFIVKTTGEITAAPTHSLSDQNKLRMLGFSSKVVAGLTQNATEKSDLNDLAKTFSRGIVNGKSRHFDDSDIIIVAGEAGAGVTTFVKKLEKFLEKSDPKNKFKALESDFSEGVPSVLKSKTSSNVTSLFRKSSEGTAEERKLLIEFDGQPEDLPKHLYKIAEVDPDLKVSIIYALSVGKSYHHVSDLMRRFDMPDVYVALTKMDLFEVSTAELSAIADANRKILFFSGLKLIEDGLDFAKVAVMESFLTNLIDNESW